MIYFEKYFKSQEPKNLQKLLSENTTFRYGAWTVDKASLIGHLSMKGEGEIEALVTEMQEMIQYWHMSKDIILKAMEILPVKEEAECPTAILAIEKLDELDVI